MRAAAKPLQVSEPRLAAWSPSFRGGLKGICASVIVTSRAAAETGAAPPASGAGSCWSPSRERCFLELLNEHRSELIFRRIPGPPRAAAITTRNRVELVFMARRRVTAPPERRPLTVALVVHPGHESRARQARAQGVTRVPFRRVRLPTPLPVFYAQGLPLYRRRCRPGGGTLASVRGSLPRDRRRNHPGGGARSRR